MIIEIDGFDVAVAAWDNATKSNLLYGSWNQNKNYIPTVDAVCKLVFRKTGNNNYIFTDDEIKGLLKVTVGNITYLH